MKNKELQWAYYNHKDGWIYLTVTTKIDFFVPALPGRTLMVFKNPTMNDWVVADYLTGFKVGSAGNKTKAKEICTDENALKVYETLTKYYPNAPEINKKEAQP